MALKTETRTIEGMQVTTTQLPAMRGLTLYSRLGGAGAPVPVLAGLDKDGGAAVLEVAFTSMQPEAAAVLVREILQFTQVVLDGKAVALGSDDKINQVFSGRIKAQIAVCWFAITVNFADFFEAASSAPAEPEEEAATPASPSPSTKTSRRRRLRGPSSSTGESR